MSLVPEFLRIFLFSMAGTLGFALLLHAPRKAWLPASALGGLSYALYWLLMQLGMSDPSSMFISSMAVSILAQYCARRMRMIATIFVTLSIISLVPGLGLYRCMELLGQGQNAAGLQAGVAAMTTIVMIVLGLAVGAFVFRIAFSFRPTTFRRKEGV